MTICITLSSSSLARHPIGDPADYFHDTSLVSRVAITMRREHDTSGSIKQQHPSCLSFTMSSNLSRIFFPTIILTLPFLSPAVIWTREPSQLRMRICLNGAWSPWTALLFWSIYLNHSFSLSLGWRNGYFHLFHFSTQLLPSTFWILSIYLLSCYPVILLFTSDARRANQKRRNENPDPMRPSQWTMMMMMMMMKKKKNETQIKRTQV